jgi:hypothetical protein
MYIVQCEADKGPVLREHAAPLPVCESGEFENICFKKKWQLCVPPLLKLRDSEFPLRSVFEFSGIQNNND